MTSDAEMLARRAGALIQRRRFSEAAATLRSLTCAHPADWTAWLNLGHVARTLGAIDEAAAAYRRAAALRTGCGAAWWGLANLKAARLGGKDIAAMRAALPVAVRADRIGLHFALAAAVDDPAEVFEQLRLGNALRLAIAPYDAERTSRSFRVLEALLTAEFVAARRNAGALERGPIFIVGLPRSGTTLVEQILASHSAVEGLGELRDLNTVARSLASPAGYLGGLFDLPPARLRGLGERYLAAVAGRRSVGRLLFTDKMPSNWLYAGLIPLILPNARIVDVRRHPLACGFANYAQHYAGGNDWAYDLATIGQFTTDYVRHMAHIDHVAPGAVHRIFYETLVADPEAETRRLLDYLSLPFDPACLRFHETQRPVDSPSSAQVRQPMDRAHVDRWRAHERWLGPLKHALGPVLACYPAAPPVC